MTRLQRLIKTLVLSLPGVPNLVRAFTRVPHGPEGISRVGHRSYVGGLWEDVGRLQFELLIREGLRPNHFLLDIGCGSLRGGVLFIPYLEPGHYLGIDKEQELIQAGLKEELSPDLLAEKRPRLIVSDAFDFHRFAVRPDYALAMSVFTHLPEEAIQLCFRNLRRTIREHGLFLATFFESSKPVRNPARPHDHDLFRYTQTQMEEFGRENGWKTQYVGDWSHPRGQVLARYHPA